MPRRRFNREFKLETVRLIKERAILPEALDGATLTIEEIAQPWV